MFSIIRLSRCSFWTARGPGPHWDPNGDGEIRTHDPLLARQVLSQLSYTPTQLLLLKSLRQVWQKENGLKWTRTTDLTLIRRAL